MDHPDYFSAINYSEIVKDYPLGAAFDQTFRSMSRVCMPTTLTKWVSKHGQMTKIRPSDASEGKTIPTVV